MDGPETELALFPTQGLAGFPRGLGGEAAWLPRGAPAERVTIDVDVGSAAVEDLDCCSEVSLGDWASAEESQDWQVIEGVGEAWLCIWGRMWVSGHSVSHIVHSLHHGMGCGPGCSFVGRLGSLSVALVISFSLGLQLLFSSAFALRVRWAW